MLQNNSFAIALVSFIAGWAIGFLSRGIFDRNSGKTAIDYRIMVLMIVSLVWLISVIYEIFNPIYQTSPLVHGLMGGIVGFFFKKQDERAN